MILGWDVESHRMKPGMMAPKLVCVSAFDGKKEFLFDRKDGLAFVKDQIRARRQMVAHNSVYDAGVIAAEDPDFLPEIFDAYERGDLRCTKIREMIIKNTQGELKFEYDPEQNEYKKQDFSLARLVLQRLRKNIYPSKKKGNDAVALNYHKLDGLHPSQYSDIERQYAIEDSVYTHGIHALQDRDIKPEHDRAPGEIDRTKVHWALNLMGTWGVRTHEPSVREYKAELEKEFAKQVAICQEHGFRRKTVDRDTKKIKSAVESWFKEHKLPMKLTKKGDISTDREQLTTTDHPGLRAVSESIRVEKLLTTYVAALLRGIDVPLNPSYNPMVETWRTSCSGGQKINKIPVGMQVQNQPRGGRVRKCVIPRKGWMFAFCDLDTIEMCTLAEVQLELFGRSPMAQAIKEGRDLHVDFASEQLGFSYRDAFSSYQAGDKEIENARQSCKISGYGCMGGMGPDSLMDYAKQYGVIFSRAQAKKLHQGFRKKWNLEPYFNYVSQLTQDGPCDIQFPLTGLYRGKVGYTQLANSLFQHPTAIFATAAVWQASKESYVDRSSPLFGCRPWLFNHDEIGMEIPYDEIGPERTHAAAMRLKDIMEAEARKVLRRVGGKASVALSPRWEKGAKSVMENGILVPVVPKKVEKDGKTKTIWEPWEGRWKAKTKRAA